MPTDDILDDLFPACALRAFIELSVVAQAWPDSDATRQLAFQLYEESLAEKYR